MSRRIKNDEKRLIANYYYNLLDDLKDYDRITGDKMFAAVYELFRKDFRVMNKLLTIDEFNKLKKIANKVFEDGFYVAKFSEIDFKESLFFKDVEVTDDETYYYLEDAALDHLLNYQLTDQDKEYDYYFHMICGMVESYGLINFDEIQEVYLDSRGSELAKLIKETIDKNFYLHAMLEDRMYEIEDDSVIHPLVAGNYDYALGEISLIYEHKFYYEVGYYGFPLAFMEALKITDVKDLKYQAQNVNFLINKEAGPHDFFERERHLLEAMDDAEFEVYLHWPLWALGGKTFDDVLARDKDAVLDLEVATAFDRFIHELNSFINRKYKYVNIKDKYTPSESFTILTSAMKNRRIFRDFERSPKMAKTELNQEFIEAFKMATFIEHGYAYAYQNNRLLVLDADNVVYHVAGINHSIEDNIPHHRLPTMVSMIVLPIKDNITYAFSISQIAQLAFGENIVSMYKESISKAKHLYDAKDYVQYKTKLN